MKFKPVPEVGHNKSWQLCATLTPLNFQEPNLPEQIPENATQALGGRPDKKQTY